MSSKGDVKEKLTAYLRELHLPTFRECFEELARRAVQETASYEQYLLELAERSEGVRIFIGSESGLFGTSDIAMVVSPARGEGGRIVGAIGVIGPTRINYGRIIPVVDYTARVIGRLLG